MDEIVSLLKNILGNISKKIEINTTLIFKGTTTDINVYFEEPIKLQSNYTYNIGFKTLSTSYSVPNIDIHNNNFKYSVDKGVTYHDINLDVGSYELDDIQVAILNKLRSNGHYNKEKDKSFILIEGHPGTQKVEISIKDKDYIIDFTADNTVGSIMGFSKQKLEYGYHVSDGIVMINPLNTILVHCDLVDGTRYNGKSIQSIYEFSPKVPPGYTMIEEVSNPTYLQISNSYGYISKVRVWLTDEDLKPLNLRGEELTIVLLLKEIQY